MTLLRLEFFKGRRRKIIKQEKLCPKQKEKQFF